MRIAMWSGPRNLSTAMMYSFGARGDCAVSDEPFYAAYLHATGIEHPMQAEILAAQPTDPTAVARHCLGPIPGDHPHWYQKHMTHHMVPGVPTDWLDDMVNVYLIRNPARVIASYAAKRENPTLEDLGFPQQMELFQRHPGPVIDSSDIRADPKGMLQKLCAEIGLPWDDGMLSWPAGGHRDDGVWARHWYGAVHGSTGFASAEGDLPNENGALMDAALPIYSEMSRKRIS